MAHLASADVEMALERALVGLPGDVWRVVDTRRAGARGPRVDFVVVGPPGVFVIGCGRRHEKERAQAKELMRLLEAAHQVAEVAGVRRDEVHPVLCLTGDQPEDSWSRGVSVCGIVNLADTLVFKRDRLRPRRGRSGRAGGGPGDAQRREAPGLTGGRQRCWVSTRSTCGSPPVVGPGPWRGGRMPHD